MRFLSHITLITTSVSLALCNSDSAEAVDLASILSIQDNNLTKGNRRNLGASPEYDCADANKYCLSTFPGSYCKYYQHVPVCQGSDAPCQCKVVKPDVPKTTTTTTTTTVQPSTTTTTTTSVTTTTTTLKCVEADTVAQCPAARGFGDGREDTKTLKIMHWNTQWLFRGDMSYEGSRKSSLKCPGGCDWESTDEAHAHMELVKSFLGEVDADIMSLNEVQDCTILETVSNCGKDGHSPYHIWGKDTYTGQNVGMISRIDPGNDLILMEERELYPVEGSKCGYVPKEGDKPKTRAPTKNYIATFDKIEGLNKPVTVIAAHLIAYPTEKERCSKREAEAIVISKRAEKAFAEGHHVVIMGDLNDFDRLNPDHDNSMPTSRVLEILRLNGKMRSVTETIPQEKRYTYDSEVYGKNSLDHVLMDLELFALIKSVEIRYDINDEGVRSDHFPIIVTLDTSGVYPTNLPETTNEPSSSTTTTTTASPTTTTKVADTVAQCPAPRGFGDGREDANTLTVMHWNTEWLFRGDMSYEGHRKPSLKCPGGCDWETSDEAHTHMELVKGFLGEVDADIMSLNEVQDCTILDTVSNYGKDGHSPYLVWGKDTYTGQNVGMISRIDPGNELILMEEREVYPLEGSQCGYVPKEGDKPKTRAPTKNYITTFEKIKGLNKPVTVIAAHLIAVPTEKERCSKREAEATVIAKRAEQAFEAGHHVMIMGDLNDFDRLNPDHDNSMPTSRVLEILRLNGKMRSATEQLPQNKRYTYDSAEYGKQSLDHFLVDTELYAMIKSVQIRYDVNEEGTLSDHFPIIVTFDTSDSKPSVPPVTTSVPEGPEVTTTAPPVEPDTVAQCPEVRGFGDLRSETNTLKIMHWNAEWLFRQMSYEGARKPNLKCPGECEWTSEGEAQIHLEEVRSFLEEVDADIYSLNEIQDCTILSTASNHGKNGHSPYMVWGADTYTGQNVGLISRIDPGTDLELMTERENYPIEGSKCGWKLDKPKTRAPTKNYITTFDNIKGLDKPVTVIGAHFIAVPTDRERCSKREAEATVVAKRAAKAYEAGHHVVIMGDLNDFDLLNLDHDSSVPTSQVLEILRLDGKMRSVTEQLPQDKRYTYDSEKYGKNSLDHILMDLELYSLIQSVEIRYDIDSSDHFPIIVTLDLDKKSQSLWV